mgnify:CR=1 FL=1
MKTGITYDDVLLVPQYSDIISRTEVDLATEFGKGVELSLPIISSPMDTVSETDMAANLGELGVINYSPLQYDRRTVRHDRLFGRESSGRRRSWSRW